MSNTKTSEVLRAEAAAADAEAAASFERCDTDGFVSQWASGLTAQQRRMEADLADNGGLAEFPQLTTLDGTPVPAKLVNTRYGTKFVVFAKASDVTDYNALVLAWIDPFVQPKTLAKKGYALVHVLAPAKVVMHGNGGRGLSGATSVRPILVRTDGGFDPAAPVVEDVA